MSARKVWKVRVLYCCAGLAVLILLRGICTAAGKAEKTVYPVVCLGDSIFDQYRDETSITSRMEQRLGVHVFNGAFGGTNMSRYEYPASLAYQHDSLSMAALSQAIAYEDFGVQRTVRLKDNATEHFRELVQELAAIDFGQVEVLFIEHGTNDYNSGIPIYDNEDPYSVYTYSGALRTVIENLQKNQPHIRIILVTPTYSWFPGWGKTCETWNSNYGYLKDYVETMKQVALEYDVECVDLYHDIYLQRDMEDRFLYTTDGLHPNEEGRRQIADALVDYLIQNPKK